ncbi:hypothetical protein PF005_g6677 [Phytophthora fragariae]|uniref:Uncharacterized protein n=1 Tax=Phytophthora fragariae TaxID=53985 RepID=A0A6A3FLS7_9STRA|nr:hypothetical protein PF003_g113 [Phytophthora fragariae]KAE8947014.1 hypothetical protein PF009_g3376 [Phytophthora fragariae]KAE9022615.1 hypothetical protein PF011_g4378 [Phytophthora fragariae]KAE9106016.1 hypothetical protein PF006_g21466 [Phytophthora fragariae]KAE9124445.1 hypothetical protein PF010_g5997 [Phytophthora fragariae]
MIKQTFYIIYHHAFLVILFESALSGVSPGTGRNPILHVLSIGITLKQLHVRNRVCCGCGSSSDTLLN